LRHSQALGRTAEAQRFRHRHELPELTQVGHRYAKDINPSRTL
jgi:hypothetical protein